MCIFVARFINYYFSHMKQLIIILVLIFGVVSNKIYAQLGYNEIKVYLGAGESIENKNNSIYIVFTINGELMVRTMSIQKLNEVLKNTPNFLDSSKSLLRYKWTSYPAGCKNFLPHDSNLSTSSRIVYKAYSPANPMWGYGASTYYYAFSKNGDSFIWWEEGKEENRIYHIEIEKSELMPKPVNYDFLYE